MKYINIHIKYITYIKYMYVEIHHMMKQNKCMPYLSQIMPSRHFAGRRVEELRDHLYPLKP